MDLYVCLFDDYKSINSRVHYVFHNSSVKVHFNILAHIFKLYGHIMMFKKTYY